MKNHIEVPKQFTDAVAKTDLNNDSIGYVESYDFSIANMSQEARIAAITTIASVCYQNPKALGSISLYDRLATENKGLPSSSYEFVPVLITNRHAKLLATMNVNQFSCSISKYGEWFDINSEDPYLLTNLRALIADVGDKADQFFNTEEECAIIAKHFKVYKTKIDLSTARQFMRHRCSWQELSRRYVSGKRAEFEFYISSKLEGTYSEEEQSYFNITAHGEVDFDFQTERSTEDLITLCIAHYDQAIAYGVKPEEARRILPQAMYTTIWSAWQPKQLEVFYKLRLDSHAQLEIRELAEGMKELQNK
jgi:thymidylate synthase (FAD)